MRVRVIITLYRMCQYSSMTQCHFLKLRINLMDRIKVNLMSRVISMFSIKTREMQQTGSRKVTKFRSSWRILGRRR